MVSGVGRDQLTSFHGPLTSPGCWLRVTTSPHRPCRSTRPGHRCCRWSLPTRRPECRRGDGCDDLDPRAVDITRLPGCASTTAPGRCGPGRSRSLRCRDAPNAVQTVLALLGLGNLLPWSIRVTGALVLRPPARGVGLAVQAYPVAVLYTVDGFQAVGRLTVNQLIPRSSQPADSSIGAGDIVVRHRRRDSEDEVQVVYAGRRHQRDTCVPPGVDGVLVVADRVQVEINR